MIVLELGMRLANLGMIGTVSILVLQLGMRPANYLRNLSNSIVQRVMI